MRAGDAKQYRVIFSTYMQDRYAETGGRSFMHENHWFISIANGSSNGCDSTVQVFSPFCQMRLADWYIYLYGEFVEYLCFQWDQTWWNYQGSLIRSFVIDNLSWYSIVLFWTNISFNPVICRNSSVTVTIRFYSRKSDGCGPVIKTRFAGLVIRRCYIIWFSVAIAPPISTALAPKWWRLKCNAPNSGIALH